MVHIADYERLDVETGEWLAHTACQRDVPAMRDPDPDEEMCPECTSTLAVARDLLQAWLR
jgi:hypothetical protein